MSYDIDARCEHCRTSVASIEPTYNYAAMFRALGIYPHDFHGKPASEYATALADALHKLNTDFDAYDKLSAGNGWGTAAQLRECLPEWIAMFERAPHCIVEVS